MDYSLVIGVDSSKQELVVGIVGQFFKSRSQSREYLLSWIRIVDRFHSNLYLEQTNRKLGQRDDFYR